MQNYEERVEILLNKECYIMDFLPETVLQDSNGQYFDVEYYLLNSARHVLIKKLMEIASSSLSYGDFLKRLRVETIEEPLMREIRQILICTSQVEGNNYLSVLIVERMIRFCGYVQNVDVHLRI